MTETKLGNSDIWGLISNIADAGNKIGDTYNNLVNAGIIKPGPGYKPPTPAVTPRVAPGVTPTERIWEKSWFLPAVIGAGLGATGLTIFFVKRRK